MVEAWSNLIKPEGGVHGISLIILLRYYNFNTFQKSEGSLHVECFGMFLFVCFEKGGRKPPPDVTCLGGGQAFSPLFSDIEL